MTDVYGNGYLHTNSSYFSMATGLGEAKATKKNYQEMFHLDNLSEDYAKAIEYAKSRELQVYHSFFGSGVNDYETFISKLRELFNGAGQVGEKLKRLKNAELKNDLDLGVGQTETFNYKIVIKDDLLFKLKIPEIYTELLNSEGGTFVLDTRNSVDLAIIKQIVNHIKGIPESAEIKYEPFDRAHPYKPQGRFNPKSSDRRAVERWMDAELQAYADKNVNVWARQIVGGITFTKEGAGEQKEITKTVKQKVDMSKLFPEKLTSSSINDAIKRKDPNAIKEFQVARNRVKYFLRNRLEVTSDPALEKAFNLAWSKLPEDHFFEGKNLIKAVLGNIGEFALDISVNYAAIKTGNTNAMLSSIIGQIVDGSRGQPRSDYELLTAIGQTPVGIQVKNVDANRYDDIEANTDLGLMRPNLGDSFVTAIANYMFNATIAGKVGDMKKRLENYAESYIWRTLNLDVKEGLIPEHTNTFYFLGGSMIIPASHLIMRMANFTNGSGAAYNVDKLMETPEFTITGLNKGGTSDKGFEIGEPPLFTSYWHGNDSTGWTPQPENQAEFNNLLAGVRIKSRISFASFLQVSSYRTDGVNYNMY